MSSWYKIPASHCKYIWINATFKWITSSTMCKHHCNHNWGDFAVGIIVHLSTVLLVYLFRDKQNNRRHNEMECVVVSTLNPSLPQCVIKSINCREMCKRNLRHVFCCMLLGVATPRYIVIRRLPNSFAYEVHFRQKLIRHYTIYHEQYKTSYTMQLFKW